MKTLVLAYGTPIDVIPWKQAIKSCKAGKAVAIEETNRVAYRKGDEVTYIPSIIMILNVYFFSKLRFVDTVPFNRRNIYIRDGGICQFCGCRVSLSKFTFDHVFPQSRGGETTWENIVCACGKCNRRKRNRTPEEARMKLISQPTIPRLSKKVVARMLKRLPIAEEIEEKSWKGYWDVTLVS